MKLKTKFKLRPDKARKEYQRFAAHLVRPSFWPFLCSMTLGSLLFSMVAYFHYCSHALLAIKISFILFVISLYVWLEDVIYEAYEGQHTLLVQRALKFAFILFIVSEVMFFASFFRSFFHYSLAPSVFIFCVWPPLGIEPVNVWGVPLLNTVLLVSSGIFLTTSHKFLTIFIHPWDEDSENKIIENKRHIKYFLCWTILFGVIFTGFQLYEYTTSTFSINDSVFGSIFYMATGFHGLHVLVGTVFLIVTLIRHARFTYNRHIGFECAAYYWHFVDVIRLFLFATVYWWGS
jgi:heme/copper-type cytochrome/quinol oxidase subunit 3